MEQIENKQKKKREAPISIRVPKDRRAAFEYNWKTSGKSLSAFVVERCTGEMGHRQHNAPQEKVTLLARLLADAGAIKAALGKLEATHSSDREIKQLLEKIAHELSLIRKALMAKAGRKS